MQYACIALLGSSDAELEDKRDHYYPAYNPVGKRESNDRSGRIPLKSGGLDSLQWFVNTAKLLEVLKVSLSCKNEPKKLDRSIFISCEGERILIISWSPTDYHQGARNHFSMCDPLEECPKGAQHAYGSC